MRVKRRRRRKVLGGVKARVRAVVEKAKMEARSGLGRGTDI